MIGQTVSHYKITKQLGAGGMGVVYEAVDLNLDRFVALKFLPPDLTRDPEAKARFVHEARAASALDHPNVCTIHEIGEGDDGQLFIVMACYQGETLRERIARGPLPLDEAVDVAQQVATGLAGAHAQEIVHRDIKPANIFVTGDGLVKVVDFGLAKLAGQTRMTRTGTTMGTVAYMSPELVRGEEADRRTDVWCLGVVLHEMVTGRLPFRGDNEQAAVLAILNNDPEPLTGLRTGVPLDLDRIVGKAMAKRPEDRYQHMDDFLVDLRAVRAHLRAESGSAGAETRTWMSTATPARGNRRPLAVMGGVLAMVLVIGALLVGLNIGGLRDRLAGDAGPPLIRSLAVLPFDNMMGDAEQDYFVEGMHEALITEMSKIGTLRVISRTSAMHYQRTDRPIPEIARELDVDALVEGSVLRVGDRVRITAQLIRGANDEHLWAEVYDRELEDILNLLSEVARTIAGEIDVTLTPGQQERLTTEHTIDPDVYELILRGQYHLNRFNVSDARESQRYFQQAIEADPGCALAHAYLAASYIVISVVGRDPPREVFPAARVAAAQALKLNPDGAGAHIALGFVELYFDWNWAGAERKFRRALELEPGNGYALHGLADVLTVHGRTDEAVEMVLQGRQRDPFSYLRNLTVWAHLCFARRYEDVIAEIEQWRTFTGSSSAGWYSLFIAYFHLDRPDEAMAELRHSSAGRDPEYAPALEEAYAESGLTGAFLVCGERLAAMAEHTYFDPLNVAMYFALAGDADRTFAWLDKAPEDRVGAIHMIAMPFLDPYRSDPRFADLMRTIGIPESGWKEWDRGGD